VFKRNEDWIVLRCEIGLRCAAHAEVGSDDLRKHLSTDDARAMGFPLRAIVKTVRDVRREKDHLLLKDGSNRSAGSFFKNPRIEIGSPTYEAIVDRYTQRRNALIDQRADWIGADTTVWRRDSARRQTDELIAGLLITTSCDTARAPRQYAPSAVHGAIRLGRGGANTFINNGGARATDVLEFARQTREAVASVYDLWLEPEVVMLSGLEL
jgi:UDP-N-acetylenolpyruvoylglucosamine reductase